MDGRPSSSKPWRYRDRLSGVPLTAVAARTLLWGLLLTGCAASGTEEQAKTWQCSLTPDGANWKCKERPGTRARDSVATTERQAAAPTGPRSSMASRDSANPNVHPHPPSLEAPEPSWQRQLPGLQGQFEQDEVAIEPVAGTVPTGDKARPVPIPEPAMARWETASKPGRTETAQPSTAAIHPPEPDSTRESLTPVNAAAGPGRDIASSDPLVRQTGRYTVQIGAFNSVATARAYIVQHGLEDLALTVSPARRNGREYQVITFGEFDTVYEATAAWRQAEGNQRMEIWVRPIQ